jgi:hypothetical protein
LNARPGRAAVPLAVLFLLVANPGCSTRSLADLTAGWAVDGAPPVAVATAPEAGTSVMDGSPAAIEPEPRPPDPVPAPDRDAAAPADTGMGIEAGHGVAADGAMAGRVTLLVGRIALSAADTAIAGRLAGLGLTPDVHEDRETATLDFTGAVLVFISATADSDKVGSALRTLARPIVVCEPYLFDDFAMTPEGTNLAVDPWGVDSQQTTIEIVASGHPLAGGLRGQVVVAGQPVRLSWGTPPQGALDIAHVIDQPSHVALFAYETGTQMVALPAPARRVGCFLDLRTASDLSPMGWTLFDAAVNWALGR